MPEQQQTLTIQQALGLAVRHHTAGRLPQAESIYNQILQSDPDQPVALHLLGVIAHQVGKNDVAVDLINKALAIKPDYAEAHSNLGLTLQDLGKLDEAVVSYHKALAIKPDYAEAHSNLGSALQDLGKLDEAVASYHKALAIKPDLAEAHSNLGNALKELGKLDEAVASYHKALTIKPDYADAHRNLGSALQEQGKLDEAVASYHKALAIKPDYAEAHNNLGNALRDLAKLDEAVASYHKALALKPDYAEAHSNLGNALQDLGKLDEAVASYHKALAIKPDYAEAHSNLGTALQEQGKLDEAIFSFDMAGTRNARAKSLECYYILEKYDVFYSNLDKLIALDKSNIRAAAISAFVADQLVHNDPYPFCKNPLDFIRVSHLDASAHYTDGLIDELLDELSHQIAVWEPIGRTTKFGFQTASNLFSNPENSLAKLDRIIKEAIDAYYSEYGSMDCTFTDLWPKLLQVRGWYVRLLDQGHQTSHIHSSGWLSGVIYLQVPEASQKDEGAIEFSIHGYEYPILNNEYPRMLHQPKEGEIILFPSSLFHKTLPISGDSERSTISFDLLPT